jgi:prepilin-type N-terminal cleavage/methylation domain-containing protein
MPSHKQYLFKRPGFTILELVVVMSIILLLTIITTISYSQIQKQSRDETRAADINQLSEALEKFYLTKGAYPAGCPDTSCSHTLFTNNTSSPPLTATTTSVQLASILPNSTSDIHDPLFTDGMPLLNRTVAGNKYVYYGGGVNNTASSASTSSANTTFFPCSFSMTLAPGQASGYIIGHYREADAEWKLYDGRAGIPITVTGPSPDCLLN